MADHGHELTDEMLADLEKRLRKEYEQAAKETQEKLDKYMKKFATKDAIWKKSVDAGIRTQEEYDKWRLQAIAGGERWEKMKARIVADHLHTNQIAREIINREMPGIFELNANFALYQVEHDSQIDTSLTLYNREAVDRILRDDPEMLLPPGRRVSQKIQEGKAERWERNKVQSVMTQGILQGESIPKLASRLASAVADSDYKAAVRNARTMATNAQNAGRYDAYNRLESNGVELTLEWAATLDNRTRHEHRMMHGQRRNVGEPFEVSGVKIMYPAQTGSFMSIENAPQELIWNCFTGDNTVDADSQIVKSYKHEYSGELITVETAGGINFTCTPNHPILTRFGWIPAAELHKGDDLLVTSTVDDGSVGRDGNVDHVHTSFEALHESLSNFGRVDQRPMTDFNFHGDVPASDVEVVSQKRLLRGCIDTGISQSFYESVLKNADPLVFSKRHLVASFRRVYISALRFMSRSRKALSLLWRGIGHANVHGLGAVADRDVVLPEYAINDLPAETIIRSQLLDGLAGRVFVDNIISVHKRSSTCHVYNLQTENGYYFVGSSINRNGGKSNDNCIIAKNCRCTILAYVKGYEHDTITHSDKMGKMTFEEWLEAKPKPQDILHQAQRGDQIEQDYIKEYRKMSKEADEILAARKETVDLHKTLADAYERRRVSQNLNMVPYGDAVRKGLDPISINLKNLDAKTRKTAENVINRLSESYDTNLTKIRTMTKQETFGNSAFATTLQGTAYTHGFTEMIINPIKCNYEKMVDRIKELRQNRYIPKIREGTEDQYIFTHEFAHTLINMQAPVTKSQNWVGLNLSEIRSARKEIEKIYDEYKQDIREREKEFKNAEFDVIMGNTSDSQAALKAKERLDAVRISRYSLENSDEFMADSFAQVILAEKHSPYAERAVNVLNKYYGVKNEEGDNGSGVSNGRRSHRRGSRGSARRSSGRS